MPEGRDFKRVHFTLKEAVDEKKLEDASDNFTELGEAIAELMDFYPEAMKGKLGENIFRKHIFKRLGLKTFVETKPEYGNPKFLFPEKLIEEKQGFSYTPDYRSVVYKGNL
ncbi:MAG: hypothetical protein IEMM0002_1533 [bacterium]|nr:MAG: hypothetical protein IEMM0002_1533 [bacterium]